VLNASRGVTPPFAAAYGDRVDHQPELVGQVVPDQRLRKPRAADHMQNRRLARWWCTVGG